MGTDELDDVAERHPVLAAVADLAGEPDQETLFGDNLPAVPVDKNGVDNDESLDPIGLQEDDAPDIDPDSLRDFDDDIILPPSAVQHQYRIVPRESFPPVGAVLIGRGTVLGAPKTAGSKTSGAAGRWVKGADGKPKFLPSLNERGIPKTFTKDSSGKDGENWRGDIRAAVLPVMRALGHEDPIDAPLALEVVFFRPRPKGHHGSGKNAAKLKDSAPIYPTVIPDAVKLMRAFEDALNKLVWADDARNVDVLSRKRYTNGPPRAQWRLWRLPETISDARMVQIPRP